MGAACSAVQWGWGPGFVGLTTILPHCPGLFEPYAPLFPQLPHHFCQSHSQLKEKLQSRRLCISQENFLANPWITEAFLFLQIEIPGRPRGAKIQIHKHIHHGIKNKIGNDGARM